MKTYNISDRVKNGRNGSQFVYILDGIDESSSATDQGKTFANDFERIAFFLGTFDSEYNNAYNKRICPNLQARIAEYLRGIPSCLSCAFTYYDIIGQGIAWGILSGRDDKKADKFCENWFNVLAFRVLQIADKVGYNYTKLY